DAFGQGVFGDRGPAFLLAERVDLGPRCEPAHLRLDLEEVRMAGLGVDRTAVADFLDGDVGLEAVRSDIAEATDLGISAVPTFVVAGQWAIPGAQDTDTFVNVLRRLVERVRPAAACGDDSCDV
ncbi:MAG: DsbA family oxidoreductase, partial [Ilumatobacteraceae bacterium]